MSGRVRAAGERVLGFFSGARRDEDFEAEVAAHLQMAVDENMQLGMSAEEARRVALVRFGGVQQSKETHRETRGLPWLDVLGQDLRYALRTLARERGFTAIAVTILALGIGSNVAVFSVVNTILFRSLPLANAGHLVWISSKEAKSGVSSQTYSSDAYEEFRDRNHSFRDVTGYFAFSAPDNLRLRTNGEPMPITGIDVIGNFFSTLGIKPMLGRSFTAEECRNKGPASVMLSYAFWKRQFAGDAGMVGRSIDLNGSPALVVGVLPESFDFGSVFAPGERVDVFQPVWLDQIREYGNVVTLIGNLKPGASVARAQAEADVLVREIYFNAKYANSKGTYTMGLTPLKEYVSGKLTRSLIVLWAAVGFILLIVCVNLSSLLLARAGARSKEFAMRAALGAGRWRLVRQLLTESLLLSGAGAVLGLVFAFAATLYVAHQQSIALPLASSVRVDGAALGWTVLIAVGAAVLFGLAPGLKVSGKDLQSSLKDMGHGTSAGRKHQRLRGVLVVTEVAIACVLLVGAGLMLRSFLRVLDVDLGFQPSQASTIKVDYEDNESPAKRTAILQEMVRQVQALPGIEAVGVTDNLPLERNRSWSLSAKGKQYAKGELPGSFVYMVTPGYFEAMRMRVIKGRAFQWSDGPESGPVVIINEAAAKYLWRDADPIGQTAETDGRDMRVVGVVADVRESSLESEGGWQMYLPMSQAGPEGAELVMRSSLPPGSLAPGVLRTLRSMNPKQPATELRPIQVTVDHSVSPRRFFVLLVTVFAALGLFLAALGIYGVISFSVTQRTQEIGIRMALGASAGRVQASVMTQTLRLAAVGVALGTVASFVIARLIASLLFATAPTDPVTFVGMVVALSVAALLAGFIPALRASRVDPMVALRTT